MIKFKANELPRSTGFRDLMHCEAKLLETGVDMLSHCIDFLSILADHTAIVNMGSSKGGNLTPSNPRS